MAKWFNFPIMAHTSFFLQSAYKEKGVEKRKTREKITTRIAASSGENFKMVKTRAGYYILRLMKNDYSPEKWWGSNPSRLEKGKVDEKNSDSQPGGPGGPGMD